MSQSDQATRDGVVAGLLAYTMWGLFPIYFKVLGDVDSLELLLHRVIWSVPFGALILLMRRQWREVFSALLKPATMLWLGLAAIAIAANWFIYIWAVQSERIFEASLGYYINPMVYVLVGVVFFREQLRRLQVAAVVLAIVGVAVLAVNHGQIPWVSLALAALFTTYGVIRKQVSIGAMPGLFIETVVLLPAAALWLLWMLREDAASFLNIGPGTDGLLLLAGPVTVMPLLLFAVAARRVSLTLLGFMQFLGPTLQFLTGLYYGEELSSAHAICFILIWLAVALFIWDALKTGRKKPPLINTTEA